MRTTVTLDEDVATQLQELAHRSRKPFKVVLNETIRKGLSGPSAAEAAPPFHIEGYHIHLRPGIDERRFNQLADELENEAIVEKMKNGR